ncbi:MAG: SCO family protein, partial [Chloroflexi bacterium]|nr:SCO family protein [Chloroflexota bacterium]
MRTKYRLLGGPLGRRDVGAGRVQENAVGAQNRSKRPAYLDELREIVSDPPFRALSDVRRASTTGGPFTLSEHRGEVILIYFGYRACPDFCPTTFAELKRVYAALDEPSDRLKIAFVTVD